MEKGIKSNNSQTSSQPNTSSSEHRGVYNALSNPDRG